MYSRFKEILSNPMVWLAATVWGVYVALFSMLNAQCAPADVNTLPYCITVFSAALVFTLPLIWCASRWRWTMWLAIFLTTTFVFVNIVYRRNFDSLMPMNSVLDAGNMDEMVFKAALATINWTDLTLLIPPASLVLLWHYVLRKRLKDKQFSNKASLIGSGLILLLWVCLQTGATFMYGYDRQVKLLEKSLGRPSFSFLIKDKFQGKFTKRIDYLLNNGFDIYLIWSMMDFSPKIKLNNEESALVTEFERRQHELDKQSPVNILRESKALRTKPNLLIIMVESLETWALEYKHNGKPVLEYIDSLKNLPGSLYFPNLVSQVSSGHSSDGHLLVLTGLLPFRESAAVTDFANNEYPSLIKAFKNKYGGRAIEIISDCPVMWNQGITYKHYGFDTQYDVSDIDPNNKTDWTNRDPYLFRFVCNQLDTISSPFAMMAVTLSLHTPYKSKLSFHSELQNLPINGESIHYLQVCKLDEDGLRDVVNTLKNRGLYDNAYIIITGDHSAHGLADNVRPPESAGQEKFIPLLVLNTDFKTQTIDKVAGQIDIYPTLLDILGLEEYSWRGLGLSLLRHSPGGATRRDFEIYGYPSRQEAARQNTAWKVSELIIRSLWLSNR
ncbi:MAG: LTA synthase family protein [Prevotella sp.]|nr:LTA synthase family protein [Prevotella sp.]MCM1075529.1 LTA synthase family protein [Ruminococcus sp.]